MLCSLSIFVIAGATGPVTPVMAQEEPITEQGYEREELGVNVYTAPSITRIFQQLDELRPLPFTNCSASFQKQVLPVASKKVSSLEDSWPMGF